MTSKFSAGTGKAAWRPTKSFWITAIIWILFLIPSVVMGGFGAWLVMFALFLIVTALYSMIFGRRSWLGLPNRKGAGGAVGAGVAALIVGAIVSPAALTPPSTIAPLADTKVAASTMATRSASPTPSSSPSPTAKYKLLDECFDSGKAVSETSASYVCTPDDKGVLVWMTEKDSKTLLAERAEINRVAEEKVVAEKAAAEKLAAEKVAADQAAAAQAAAAEAARVAAEQAAQQQVPEIQPLVDAPAGNVYYANCSEAKAAGAAPLYIGQPGYRPKMDGDSDGVACER